MPRRHARCFKAGAAQVVLFQGGALTGGQDPGTVAVGNSSGHSRPEGMPEGTRRMAATPGALDAGTFRGMR